MATQPQPAALTLDHLVVRNTFIDAVVDDNDDENLWRTQSDPTGGRSKNIQTFARSKPQALAEEDERTQGLDGQELVEGEGEEQEDDQDDDEEDYEEDDDEDEPLQRTKSVAYPHAQGIGGQPMSVIPGGNPLPFGCMAMPYPGQMGPWPFPPMYMMYPTGGYSPWNQMVPAASASAAGDAAASQDGEEEALEGKTEASASSVWRPQEGVPALGAGPPLGALHNFHPETREMGVVTGDFRQFTKVGYEGRLSVVSEGWVHPDSEGVLRYLVQFTAGELSRADGVGFVFSPRLPCAKNIQRIVSIFVNQRGRICMRVYADIVRASAYVKPLELGDWVEMAIDLEQRIATFNIWPATASGWPVFRGKPASTAVFPFGTKLARLNQDTGQGGRRSGRSGGSQSGQKPVKLNVGHLACVVKNVGVTITLGS